MNGSTALLWIFTFIVHGALLIGLVAWMQRFRRRRGLADAESWWRLALLGPVFSATLSMLAPDFSHRWRVPIESFDAKRSNGELAATPPAQIATATIDPTRNVAASKDAVSSTTMIRSRLETDARYDPASVPGSTRRHQFAEGVVTPVLASERAHPGRLSSTLLFAVVAGLLLWAIATVVRAVSSARRVLLDRQDLDLAAARAALEELRVLAGMKRPVRLSQAPRLRSPVSFGVIRPEICLPTRALEELEPEVLRAVLAHEVYHLRRRDPLWSWLHLIGRCLIPLQPFHLWLLPRLEQCAEQACDDFAADVSGGPLRFASSLATVAEWVSPGRSTAPMSAMATRGRALTERIEHLLHRDEFGDPSRSRRSSRSTVVLASSLLFFPAFAPMRGPQQAIERSDLSVGEELGSESETDAALAELLDLELTALTRQIHALRLEMQERPDDPEVSAILEALERRSRTLVDWFASVRTRQATEPNAQRSATRHSPTTS